MKKKKILILVPTLQYGGQERVASNMAKILSEHHEVIIVVFDGRDNAFPIECELLNLSIPSESGKVKKIKNVFKRALALRKIRNENKIDFSISTGQSANLVNVLSGGSGKTIVRTSSYSDCQKSRINRIIFHRSDRIICCAEQIRSQLLRSFRIPEKKAVTIFNPLDIDMIYQRANEPFADYNFSEHTLVAHGRLDPIKNYPRVIRAFSLVKPIIADAQLLIIGDGEERENLEKLVKNKDLQSSITLLGFRDNVFKYLKQSSVYVLSSYYEGFPNAMLEGMCFLPVIAADCNSGPREILSEGSSEIKAMNIEEVDYGILVPPANIEQLKQGIVENISEDDRLLAKAIIMFFKDKDKRTLYKEKAAYRVKEFSFANFKKKMDLIIDES